ncbi:hypothetical protein [Clostridium felsineum]|uniref:Uncharacterized protein n=1 Tax=Clostridium felsineum TaxID=36839 RepID=A0A1S8LR75_9CLOT|nr:hypothetical protein [Clostridium felsineum]MCR3758087.1 hypothetical protein [Clostridium felsineum]URZ01074.1 hypothetical protein CLAUR_010620 [Clostridium felsineum]URZ06176.1 hypothetical protein CLROS_015090 [Clostridium felsineum]URZ11211.1 hypothetical protein CROST_019280 [Clostridium felsineum]URZ15878.1 hypothetical protein CLFE_019250 [Clostridium felsineum DSM 794]
MKIKLFLDYKDYHIVIEDEGEKVDVVVNFTKHQHKRSRQRGVDKRNILESLLEVENNEILYLKNNEKAVIRDFKRNISYAVEVYSDFTIVTNVITSLNRPNLKAYKGEKIIFVGKEEDDKHYLN